MKNFLRLLMAIAIIATLGLVAHADQHIDSAQLPATAKALISKHYANTAVRECEKDGGKYEVELRNGVDLEFTSDGKLLKIDAGSKKVPVALLKEILPVNAVKELESRKSLDNVEEVEIRNASIKVELHKLFNDKLRFDPQGNLLSTGE